MKNLKVTIGILSIAFVTLAIVSCKNEPKKEAEQEVKMEQSHDMAMTNISFGVRGNCEMCKMTIEKAANGLEGVSKAVWNVDQKKIDVSFDDAKTNEMAIHNAIANSGYDTDKMSSNQEAYSKLPSCCQYDHSMVMNQIK